MLQRPPEALVDIILAQHRMIEQMIEEVERLKTRMNSDSQSSSKPPSSDIHKRSEKPKETPDSESTEEQRKPGGQPGHMGKTRKGFGRIDRYELLRPQQCQECGGDEFMEAPVSIQTQTVAQLVERPIEVVAYQQHTCRCRQCGTLEPGRLPNSVVAGQSLG